MKVIDIIFKKYKEEIKIGEEKIISCDRFILNLVVINN